MQIDVASHQKEALRQAIEWSHGRIEIEMLPGPDELNGKWITVNVPEDEVSYAISPAGKLTSD